MDKHSIAKLMKTTPYKHQWEALEISWEREYFALLMEMGTGKTKVAIDNAAVLWSMRKLNAILVIAPKGVYQNWTEIEIPKHLHDSIPYFDAAWHSVPNKKQQEALSTVMHGKFDDDTIRVLVMNTEGFAFKRNEEFARKFLMTYPNNMLIVDESTGIKNQRAKRTRAIIRVGKFGKYRRILTGMAITRSPVDVYSQTNFLKPGLLGYRNFTSFRARYCEMTTEYTNTGSYPKVVGYRRLDELKRNLQRFSFRATKEQCLDLPRKVFERRYVELSPEQRKIYKELKEEAIIELSNREVVTASIVLTKLIKLHQIVCGFLNTDDGNTISIPNNRVNSVLDVLDEVEGKVIMWATYTYNVKHLTDTLKEKYGKETTISFYGDTSQEKRLEAINRFQDPSDPLKYFVGQPKVGGFGITLTEASAVLYYSNSYDLETRAQSEDRAHRVGQTKSVTYVDFICPKTIDEIILLNLRNKKELVKEVLTDGWEKLFSII
jgi:SNF2 family DNA or RNA helicase